MSILRSYQQDCFFNIKKLFAKNKKHIIVQMPTGGGKTIVFSEIAKSVANKSNKVLILTNRVELLTQAGGSIKRTGLNSFYIQEGCKVVSDAFNCFIAMTQTLQRRVKDEYWINFLNSIDLLIIDECHIQSFNYIFEFFKDKYVLGFTATPKRSGKMRQLGLDFDEILATVTVKELIDSDYLVNDDYYGLDTPNLNGVEIDRMKGDYKEGQLFQKFNTPQLYSGVVKNYIDICNNTKALVFCVNIEHCISTAKEFEKNGIKAKFIVSDISNPKLKDNQTEGEKARYIERKRVYDLFQDNKHLTDTREKIFKDFAEGKFNVLINAGIATTGYDCPSIETIILNRSTISLTLLLQMIGRGSRINEGKTHFNILDFGGNCSRLGYYTEDRYWCLWHDEYKGEGLPPIKSCGHDNNGKQIKQTNDLFTQKGCNRLILASYNICPFCGFKYPKNNLSEAILNGVVFNNELKKAVSTKRIKDMSFAELKEYYEIKGHKPTWLWRQLKYKGGEKAIKEYGEIEKWRNDTIKKAIDFVKTL